MRNRRYRPNPAPAAKISLFIGELDGLVPGTNVLLPGASVGAGSGGGVIGVVFFKSSSSGPGGIGLIAGVVLGVLIARVIGGLWRHPGILE